MLVFLPPTVYRRRDEEQQYPRTCDHGHERGTKLGPSYSLLFSPLISLRVYSKKDPQQTQPVVSSQPLPAASVRLQRIPLTFCRFMIPGGSTRQRAIYTECPQITAAPSPSNLIRSTCKTGSKRISLQPSQFPHRRQALTH